MGRRLADLTNTKIGFGVQHISYRELARMATAAENITSMATSKTG
jgi:hypothetical protein